MGQWGPVSKLEAWVVLAVDLLCSVVFLGLFLWLDLGCGFSGVACLDFLFFVVLLLLWYWRLSTGDCGTGEWRLNPAFYTY